MSGLPFVLRMARREARGAARHLALLGLTVAIGVAASVSVGSFADNLQDSVREQARALLGADVYISRSTPFSPDVEALVDALARDAGLAGAVPGDAFARITLLQAMARVGDGPARLVQLNAAAGGYPFYGEHRTDPAGAWARLSEDAAIAIVEPALLELTGARVGDALRIGEAELRVVATVHDLPGSVSLLASLGPRVFIPRARLAETGLMTPTTRALHRAFVKLPATVDADRLVERHRAALGPERVVLRTVSENEGRLNDQLSRLARYLSLVGLLALLLGGIGVASAAHVLVRRRMDTVAVLRCLGAGRGTVLAVYLIEAGALGLAGSLVGAVAGSALQLAIPELLEGVLPVDVATRVSPRAVGAGVLLGVSVAVLFSLPPLLAVRAISPLRVLRADLEPPPPSLRHAAAYATAGFAVVAAVSGALLGSATQGLAFAAGLAAALGLLRGAAGLVQTLARRALPPRLPYVWRQGFQNLYRPRSQTVTVIVSLGFGAFLVQALILVQQNLLRDLRGHGDAARPNLVFIDVQPDQRAPLLALLAEGRHRARAVVPVVPMRIEAVGGRSVREVLSADGDGPGARDGRGRWAFRREYRSTYRDALTAAETTVRGSWSAPDAGSVSLDADLAEELGVGIGEEIVWNVQGRLLTTRVTHLRDVEWTRFEPNFFAVFAETALRDAPQTFVATTRVDDAAHRGALQRRVADRFPNVSAFDIASVQQTLEKLIERVALALRFTAGFTLVAGIGVLAGAVAASRSERTREGALLKVLGATRGQVLCVLVAEYLSLGLIATAVGALLSVGGGWAITALVFDARFALPAGALLLLALLVAALSVGAGLLGSLSQVARPPLAVLRAE